MTGSCRNGEPMTEINDHYMEDSLWEVTRFLEIENIDKNQLSEKLIDDMAYHYYKNYYDYEMDNEYALRAAVSEVLQKNEMVIEGFEKWIP